MPWRNAGVIAALAFLSAPHILLTAEPDRPTPFRWKKIAEVADAERVFPSAVDPNTVFVWTRGGLLVSKDDGLTFAARDKGVVQQLGTMTALLVNPIRPAMLYAGTLAKGIFVSNDEGATWRALGGVDKGLASNRIHALVFSPDDPTFTTIFATHSMQQPGISMTIDGGTTWRVFARDYGVNDLILVGARIFFAGAHPPGGAETGFFRSIDAGQNWFRILNVDLPTALVASRASFRRAWCGTANGLFVTDDFGVSSRAAGPQAGMNIASIAGGYGSPEAEHVYLYDPNSEGVLASNDGFKTWRKLNEGLYVGDWVAEGAMMAAAGSTLYACVNGALYRGAAPGPARLSSIRAEPAAVVAGADAVVFSCRAAPGAEVAVDLSLIGGPAALSLRDDGKNGDGAAGDGVFGARLEKVSLDILAKARSKEYGGPTLPGQVALKVQAKLAAASETGFALLTVLQPAANMKLWNGESHSTLVTRGEGGVGVSACQEHPFSGDTHLRVRVSGPGLAGFGWHKHGVWPGTDDMRFHKLFTFCIRSNTPGPSELKVMLRDDGANYGSQNARSSNQLSLSRYLPQLTTRYQRVAIPMADFVWGSAVAPDGIRELSFIAPSAETRIYDVDDVGLAAKPGPILSDCEAALAADATSVRVSARATSASGTLKSVKVSCEGKEFDLYDDGKHGDGESGDGCFADLIPPAQLGTGTRSFRFAATDADGATDDTATAFLPRLPPGQIARARSSVKVDGDLAEFADVTPFVISDDKLGLRARVLYEKNSLYVAVEVKDAAYNPQPLKKGQRKPPPEKLAESGSAELAITSPTAATCIARANTTEDDLRFVFVMDEQQAYALRGNHRLPAAGKRTEATYVIEAQIPFDVLRTRRGQCDFERGKQTRIEWRLLGADGKKLVWNAGDAEKSANPDNWGLARFTDEPGASKLRYTRTDGKVLTLVSSKRLKSDAAQRAASYEVPGVRIENVTLEHDGRTVRLTADRPWKIGDTFKVKFNGLQSEDGFPTEPELAFSPLPGRPLNGELLREFLIGEVRENVDVQSVTKAHIDEAARPARGPQWSLANSEGGIFNLSDLTGGLSNALVHAHAYLYADKDRAVQVWVGSDDGVRVVVNGAPVFSVPTSRGCTPDQDRIKNVKLKAGWNSLLLAVWNGSGDWSLCARIMDENGNPPEGVSYQADSPFAAPPAQGTGDRR